MNKYIFRRYLLFVISIFINAFGIVFITKANLGTTPITGVNYVLSMFTPYTIGQWTIIVNILFVAIELLIMTRKELKADLRMYLLQIPITICFGWSIDLSMNILWWLQPSNYIYELLCIAIGSVILATGISLEVKANIALVPGEFMVRSITRRVKFDFGYVKLGFDITLVALAVILSFSAMGCLRGVREGTVIAALVVGPIVHMLTPFVKYFDNWLGENKKSVASAISTTNTPKRIITITREYGSGGHDLGKALAQELGIPFYDKEIINMTAEESDMTKQFVSQNEQFISPDWIRDAILHDYESPLEHSLSPRDILFVAQSRVIRKIAEQESCVIVGRCANYVLKDFPDVIKIFCYSDMESAKIRCHKEYGIPDDKTESEIKRVNQARIRHYEHYTGDKWGNYNDFDLMINTGSMSIDEASKLIANLYNNTSVS